MGPEIKKQWICRAAVSLIAGILAVIACYMVVSVVSRHRTDVYTSFRRDGIQTFDRSELFPRGAIDPNTATAEELMLIPGIGEKTAEAIILERETNGPFLYPEDLMAVSGIGQKKLDSFRPYFYFEYKSDE